MTDLKIYTYFTLHCPIILYECANIDRMCVICQKHAGAVGCKRHKGMIFTFKKNTVSWKTQAQIYSPTELFVSSPLWDPWVWRQKFQSFFYVQHKAEHTVDTQEIALNLNQHRRRTPTRPHLHKGNCHASWTPLSSFFYEVMVKVKGIHLYLEKLKDSNPT